MSPEEFRQAEIIEKLSKKTNRWVNDWRRQKRKMSG